MSRNIIIRNSAAGLLQFILTAVLTLIVVPIFIHKLGIELYGIFAVVSIIGNLNLLTNFGLNNSLLIYVAKQGKCNESDLDIVVTQILILIIVMFFIFIITFFKGFIVQNLFSIPAKFSDESESLLIYLALANGILLFGQTFTAIMDSVQKVYLTSLCQFIYSTIYWGGIITVVSFGGSLNEIGIVILTSAISWFIIVFIISRNIWGKLDLRNLGKDFKRIAFKQLSYGTKIYVSGLVGFLFEPLSKILLSNFIGLNAVAFFEIGMKLKGQISGILTKIIYPMLPFIANRQDNQDLKDKIFDLSKKLQLLVIPISIAIAFSLPILVKLWIGAEHYQQAAIFAITMSITALMFSVPILPIYQYLAAKNLADKNIWIQLSSVIVNIVIFFTLYKFLDVYTILIANTIAFITSYFMGNYYQYKFLHIYFKNERSFYLKLFYYSVPVILLCLIIKYLFQVSYFDILIYPFIICISFVVFIRISKLITLNDLEIYLGTIPVLKNTLTRILIT